MEVKESRKEEDPAAESRWIDRKLDRYVLEAWLELPQKIEFAWEKSHNLFMWHIWLRYEERNGRKKLTAEIKCYTRLQQTGKREQKLPNDSSGVPFPLGIPSKIMLPPPPPPTMVVPLWPLADVERVGGFQSLTCSASQTTRISLWHFLWIRSLHWVHLKPWRPKPQIRSLQ